MQRWSCSKTLLRLKRPGMYSCFSPWNGLGAEVSVAMWLRALAASPSRRSVAHVQASHARKYQKDRPHL